MMRVLSKEESAQYEKEMNDFLLSLDWNTKSSIITLLKPLLKQTVCEHNWIDPNSYENELNKEYLFCNKCHLIKKKI